MVKSIMRVPKGRLASPHTVKPDKKIGFIPQECNSGGRNILLSSLTESWLQSLPISKAPSRVIRSGRNEWLLVRKMDLKARRCR